MIEIKFIFSLLHVCVLFLLFFYSQAKYNGINVKLNIHKNVHYVVRSVQYMYVYTVQYSMTFRPFMYYTVNTYSYFVPILVGG
jgi:hypothetical protein